MQLEVRRLKLILTVILKDRPVCVWGGGKGGVSCLQSQTLRRLRQRDHGMFKASISSIVRCCFKSKQTTTTKIQTTNKPTNYKI